MQENVKQKNCTVNSDIDLYFAKNQKNIIFISLSAALIVFVLYFPSLKNDFVNWDDNSFVYENEHIRVIDLNFLKWIFQFHHGNWCPLTWVSHAFDYFLWNMNPLGHHLTSIIFHVLNTFLFTILIIKFLKIRKPANLMMPLERNRKFLTISLVIAITAGLFFGISPLRVESVVWISERRDVLFLFCALLSIIFYLKYYEFAIIVQHKGQKKHIIFYLLSLTCFLAGLMSKSMIMSLPIVLLLIDMYPLERFISGKCKHRWTFILLEKVPFLILSIVLSVVTFVSQSSVGAVYSLVHMPILVRILIGFKAYAFYLIKSVLPKDLAPLYLIKETTLNALSYQYLMPIILFIIITIFCSVIFKRIRLFLIIWSFYLLTLLPVIGFIQVGNQFAADRYTYFPGLGLAFLFGIGVGIVYKKVISLNKTKNVMLFALATMVICFFGMHVFFLQKQIIVWRNSINLWNQEIKLYPGIVAIPYKNRGAALFEVGKVEDAIRDFTAAVELNPGDHTNYINIALAFLEIGDLQSAMRNFTIAARLGNVSAQKYLTSKGIKWHESK